MSRIVGIAGGLIAVLAGSWLIWQWGFCRFYVAPGQMAVITAKSGDALPPASLIGPVTHELKVPVVLMKRRSLSRQPMKPAGSGGAHADRDSSVAST